MGYMDIDNLYKNQDILMYKECYAMEKIHGTSAHISYKDGKINFFSGGFPYEVFVGLFDKEKLLQIFKEVSPPDRSVHIYGEFYGSKYQGMSATYGNIPKFVCFDVKIGSIWLTVPKAEIFCLRLGLDFVYYTKIPCTLQAIDEQRDAPSVQAARNGITEPRKREGIVLRPLEEVIKNNGERIIAKHKNDDFRETKTPRNLTDKLIIRAKVKEIVDEWVTEERLNHILTSGEVEGIIENTGKIIHLMIEDIYKEGKGEIVESKDLEKAISRETALMFKRRLRENLREI